MSGATLNAMRVLVVDDDVDSVDQLAEGLRALGHEAIVARSADEVLSLSDLQADAAILDIHLEGASGLELAKELRRRGHTMRLIAWTGDARITEATCRAAGFDAFMTKPISMARLAAVARSASGAFKTVD